MTARGIINTYDQLVAAGGVAIIPASGPLNGSVSGWYIYRVSAAGKQIITDKDATWYHYGKKWIMVPDQARGLKFHARQAAAFEAAKEWVAKTYGEQGPWKRNAHRDYVPERIQKQFPIRRNP